MSSEPSRLPALTPEQLRAQLEQQLSTASDVTSRMDARRLYWELVLLLERVPAGGAVLLAVLLLSACSATPPAERGDGPPLYVHLCDAMPAADADAWGDAAGDLNAELGEPVLFVGHGPPIGCDTVDVCPSSAMAAGAEVRMGECVITVRYAPGAAGEVAAQELAYVLEVLP